MFRRILVLMVSVGSSFIISFSIVFLFSVLSVVSFILGFRFGQSTVPVCAPEEPESGFMEYKPAKQEKYKAIVPGRKDEDVEL